MKTVFLKFPDKRLLWAFSATLKCIALEINENTQTLFCECSDEEINLAVMEYKAIILDQQEERKEGTRV